jgi:hypothetical protein
MGKIDDMRRLREAQHAATTEAARQPQANGRAATRASETLDLAAAPTAVLAPPRESAATKVRREPPAERPHAAADPEGRCAVCGKVRALQNGLVTNHQKGLGKACPGSRRAPA